MIILINFVIFSIFMNDFLSIDSLFNFSLDTSPNRVIFYFLDGSFILLSKNINFLNFNHNFHPI